MLYLCSWPDITNNNDLCYVCWSSACSKRFSLMCSGVFRSGSTRRTRNQHAPRLGFKGRRLPVRYTSLLECSGLSQYSTVAIVWYIDHALIKIRDGKRYAGRCGNGGTDVRSELPPLGPRATRPASAQSANRQLSNARPAL